MPRLTEEQRTELANRLNGGQPLANIAAEMKISVKTVYRLKTQFEQEDGNFEAIPPQTASKRAFNREELIQISEWLQDEPKLTLAEIRDKLVTEGFYSSLQDVPDSSTLWRRLKNLDFKWRKPVYSDPRTKRDVIKYERCVFRMAQDNGLDPTTLLSIDETNFYYEQATRGWGTSSKAAILEKPKGKIMRRSMIATIGFNIVNGEPKVIIHWVFIPPRKSWRPLEDTIQKHEIEEGEKAEIKSRLTSSFVNSLSCEGLKNELKTLKIRSTTCDQASMRDVLIRVGRRGSREDELRARGKGRPTAGGQLTAPTGNARMVSEYLYSCLAPFLKNGKLHNADGNECTTTMDEGIESCPDGGKFQYRPRLSEMSILWDSAPSHLPSNHVRIGPFHKYSQEKLGLKGVIHTPPYSAWFNPVELFFSYVKRYVRKFAPATIPELLKRIREATTKIDGMMVMGWFKKSGYLIPGEAPRAIELDPNAGVENRCTLPKNATFQRREHVACYDAEGQLKREKKTGHKRWSRYDELEEEKADGLRNISVTKRTSVPQKKRKIVACDIPEGKTRWAGLGEEPEGLFEHASNATLWDKDSYDSVEAIVGERVANGKAEFCVKWVGFDDSYNEWLTEDKFSAGFSSMLKNWREIQNNREEKKQIGENAHKAKAAVVKPLNRSKFTVGDALVILAPKKADRLFYVAKVLEVGKKKLKIHWFHSKKIDGAYKLEYAEPSKKGKGVGRPNTAVVWKETVVDSVTSLRGKRNGKIEKAELKRLVSLASSSSNSNSSSSSSS